MTGWNALVTGAGVLWAALIAWWAILVHWVMGFAQ